MKAFSTFSGIGGFELGFAQAGIHIDWVGSSEIDPFASSIYRSHFSSFIPHNYGDITTIKTSDLPDFDLLTGGFPCQSFSTLGRRGGFDDQRGILFFEIVRILRDKTPQFFVLENVKGLLAHDQGRTFRYIITALTDVGYCVQWQVLNSQNFGVPQQRERVFIVGYFGESTRHKIFPLTGTNSRTDGRVTKIKRDPVVAVTNPRKRQLRRGNRRFKHPGEPMFTITTSEKHGICDGQTIRVLTPLECERLQGFPDGWTEYGVLEDGRMKNISDTQRYKCLGNAVTVDVVTAIAGEMFGKTQEKNS